MCRYNFHEAILNKTRKIVHFKQTFKSWDDDDDDQHPIFWIIGPNYTGKTSLAYFLAECSNYRVIHMKNIANLQANTETESPAINSTDPITLLKADINNTYKFSQGYIIDDFPSSMRECKRFERKIGKPDLVIYLWLNLDAALGRALAQHPTIDLNRVRVNHVKQGNFAEKLAHRYEKRNKLIKIFSQYPMQDTHAKVLELLETDFGYKFRQVVKTN